MWAALQAAVVGAGYAKDKCSAQACYYEKDGERLTVQPMDFKVKKKKLTNISMRLREATAKK